MADTINEGFFRAETGNASDRPLEMENRLVELDGDRNPNLEMVLRRIGGGPSGRVAKKRMKYEWRSLKKMPKTCKITVVDAVGQSHIEVDNYQYIHRDDLLYNTRTGELYLCNEDAAVAPNATVDILSYSNAATTLLTATAVDDEIIILTESHAEGEEFPEAYRMESEDQYDYIMELARRSADISNIAINEEMYDPRGQRAIDNKNAMIELMEGINRLLYVSQTTREVISASGARRHALGGLRQKIVTNKQSLAGVPGGLTPQVIGEILRKTKIHTSASMTKIAMSGQYALAAASAWPEGYVRVSPREKAWGFDVKQIITPHGSLDLVYDQTLSDDWGMADVMCIIDPQNIRQVYLQNTGMRVLKKLSSLSTAFRIVDGVTTSVGLQTKNEPNFAWIEDIS